MISKRTVSAVTWVVNEGGIGLPTSVTFQSNAMVTVMGEAGI